MERNPEYANAVIDAFKGTTRLAKALSAPVSTVHSWRTIGIPASRLAHIELVAKAEGVKLPKPDRSQAAA